MELKFRKLYATEIDVRVGNCSEKGCSLLLYKDARVDMNLLDETVGQMNWTREHTFKENKLYCKVSIWDEEKKIWVFKEDVGTESNTEQEKGQASDSFKRVCVNWGIGRELYTSPFIWVNLKPEEVKVSEYQGKKKYQLASNIKFNVELIDYDDVGNVCKLAIVDNNGNTRYTYGCKPAKVEKPVETKKAETLLTAEELGMIKGNQSLISKMAEICGGRKYSSLNDNEKENVAKEMRKFLYVD